MNENPFQTADLLARARRGVATLDAGKSHKGVRCVVRGAEVKTTRDGRPYLSVRLADRTGEREAKSWDGAHLLERLADGTVVDLGRLDHDGKGFKFDPKDLTVVAPGTFDPADFVPSLPGELIDHLWRELQDALDTIEDADVRRLRHAVFTPALSAAYKVHPSAVSHHHNYLGGNVQHVVGITRVVDAVCRSYPELDRDVVLFGAAVHDLGKLREYTVDTTVRVTEEGKLKGHLVLGAEMLASVCAEERRAGRDVPKGLQAHLEHMILSHHLKGEWGSPKPPATPEAMLLHLADFADSQTKGFLQAVEELGGSPEGWAWRRDGDRSGWIRTRRDWDA